jgi:hypothetical protein
MRSALETGEIAQRPDAGQEEIGAAFYRYKAFQVVDAPTQRIGLHGEYFVTLAEISNEWIDLAVEAAEYRIVNPGLLNKLELSFYICIQTEEVKSSWHAVINPSILWSDSV